MIRLYDAQFFRCSSTRSEGAGVFTQPRPQADIVRALEDRIGFSFAGLLPTPDAELDEDLSIGSGQIHSRPRIAKEERELIRRMSLGNPTLGRHQDPF